MKTLFSTALFAAAFCFSNLADGQRLWASVGYDGNGQPTEPSQDWDIDGADGAAIYFVYRTEGARDAEPNSLLVRHRPLRSATGEWVVYDEVYQWAASGDGWRVFDYLFKEDGVFEMAVKSSDGRILAATTVTLSPPGTRPAEWSRAEPKPDMQPETYSNPSQNQPSATPAARADLGRVRMATCTGVRENGDPTGIGTEFRVPAEGAELFSIVQTDKPFNAWKIEFELWKLDDFGFESMADVVGYDVRPEWNWFKTPFRFRDAGRYKVKFFVGDGERRPVSEAIFRVSVR